MNCPITLHNQKDRQRIYAQILIAIFTKHTQVKDIAIPAFIIIKIVDLFIVAAGKIKHKFHNQRRCKNRTNK